MDQDQPDEHMEDREAEKLADLEALADALAAFRQLRRPLDQLGGCEFWISLKQLYYLG